MCKEKAEEMNISVPTYSWFMLQFWPTNRYQSKILHHTGRFKVKRMIQSCIIRKENYRYSLHQFHLLVLEKKAFEHLTEMVFILADAKCKVQVGEPGYPIAAVSRGKHVIVGRNEAFAVGDHNFTKLLLIPDAILVHDISEDNTSSDTFENEDGNARENIGRWYQGQVYYGIKEMALEGSSAIRNWKSYCRSRQYSTLFVCIRRWWW